jgi:nonsense-mediated mRNA decay protein 3
VELPRVCKDDLVILPKKFCQEVGGANALAICYKIGSQIHFFDPVTFKIFEVTSNMWFNHEADVKVIPFKGNETEFEVIDIYQDTDRKTAFTNSFSNIEIRFAHLMVRRTNDKQEFTCITQLGHILKHGDMCIGYDLTSLNSNEELTTLNNQRYLPDVLIIRKTYPKGNRIWKLKRMEVEEGLELAKPSKKQKEEALNGDKDMRDFCEEIEQSKTIRSKINLFRVV